MAAKSLPFFHPNLPPIQLSITAHGLSGVTWRGGWHPDESKEFFWLNFRNGNGEGITWKAGSGGSGDDD